MGCTAARRTPLERSCSSASGRPGTSSPRLARMRRMVGLVKARTASQSPAERRRASSTAPVRRTPPAGGYGGPPALRRRSRRDVSPGGGRGGGPDGPRGFFSKSAAFFFAYIVFSRAVRRSWYISWTQGSSPRHEKRQQAKCLLSLAG